MGRQIFEDVRVEILFYVIVILAYILLPGYRYEILILKNGY